MQKVGEYWVPDIDMRGFRNRRKTVANYQNGGHGKQIGHLAEALEVMIGALGAEALSSATAIDAGANVGAYSRLMAAHFGQVHAFELAPDTHDCLSANIADWGLTDRITAHQKAISDQPGSVGLGSGGWFRRSISREIKGQGEIPAIALDDLGLSGVRLLKLDIEGHEEKALRGASRMLAESQPYVMMELKERHVQKGKADLGAHNLLLSLGYTVVADLGDPVIDRLYAPPA